MISDASRRHPSIAREMGNYLHGLAWHHWATLTYQYPRQPERIPHDVERGWLRICARNAQQPLAWFYCVERSPAGLLHVHALIWGTEHLTTAQLNRDWHYGRTTINRYESNAGGAWYAAKDVCDRAEWWNVSRRQPPRVSRWDNHSMLSDYNLKNTGVRHEISINLGGGL